MVWRLQYNNQSFYSSFGDPDYNIDNKQSQPVCDCAKTLLSSCIPYLELYVPIVKLTGPDFEVNPEMQWSQFRWRNLVNHHKCTALNPACHQFHMQNLPTKIRYTYPMVVMKLVVKVSSENQRSRQLFPTPAKISLHAFSLGRMHKPAWKGPWRFNWQ